jgi:hypothetical protein
VVGAHRYALRRWIKTGPAERIFDVRWAANRAARARLRILVQLLK